jgi:hypothetical protein
MKVVYSLLAAFVVGGMLIPISMAQYPSYSESRYSTPPTSSTQSRSSLSLAQNAATPKKPASVAPTSGTPTSGTPTIAPPVPTAATLEASGAFSSPVSSTRIVTEQRPTTPAPRGAEPVPAIQEPTAGFPIAIAPSQHVPLSLGALQPTTEMWFYEQMRQDYNNPALQVRRNSERAAAERKARLASMEWYGMSNSRPMAYTTPHMYHYSPTWTGGRREWSWTGPSTSPIVIDARRVQTLGVSGVGTW